MVVYDGDVREIIARVDRLQRLAVFDAAARAGSFTAAATALSISQPAVTRHIQELERALDLQLFERTANRSSLTRDGRALWDAVDTGFATIERRLAELHDPNPMFVLAAPPGFAQQLIVPVLDGLHDELLDVDIRLWLYDRDDELDTGDYDLAIRLGPGGPDGVDDVELFGERVIPIATHALATEWGLHADSTAEDVLRAPLLHMEAAGRPWESWSTWLAAFGLTLTAGRRRTVHNSYPTVIQRALAGRGIALGWRGVVDQLIDDELLVCVGPEVSSGRSYRLTWPSSGANDPRVHRAAEWILSLTVSPDHQSG